MSNNITQRRIRELREQAGLTQQQVADTLGCSLRAYRRYEGDLDAPAKILSFLGKCYAVVRYYLRAKD